MLCICLGDAWALPLSVIVSLPRVDLLSEMIASAARFNYINSYGQWIPSQSLIDHPDLIEYIEHPLVCLLLLFPSLVITSGS
jgi:hypothetical protein